jgi:hypothetical protein
VGTGTFPPHNFVPVSIHASVCVIALARTLLSKSNPFRPIEASLERVPIVAAQARNSAYLGAYLFASDCRSVRILIASVYWPTQS